MIGLGTSLSDVGEFNRRARIALNGVEFHRFYPMPDGLASALRKGGDLTSKQQQELIEIVHRYRKQITDVLVKDYAAARSKKS